MDDVLSDGFYQDEFLARTLNTSLYDKNALDLSFTDNNNYSHPPKTTNNRSTLLTLQDDGTESPNLDFLKLVSPDLEQMFMNIENENELTDTLVHTTSREPSPTNNSTVTSTASFNIDEDLLDTNSYFTETLQNLHDKQIQSSLDSLDLLDVTIKLEKDDSENCQQNQQENVPKFRQRKQCSVKLNPQKTTDNNIKNNPRYLVNNKDGENALPLGHHTIINNQHRILQQQPTSCMTDQMVSLGHQIPPPLITTPQRINQDNRHHQHQDLTFITPSLTSNYQHQRHHQEPISNSNIAAQNISQIPAQMQQKILEQHLIHQHGNHNNVFTTTNTQLHNIQRLNEINAAGLDERTLKMFVDNPHLAPINLEIQELIKRERKKLRNRIASSKCRKRKLEREGRLER